MTRSAKSSLILGENKAGVTNYDKLIQNLLFDDGFKELGIDYSDTGQFCGALF